MDNRILVDVDGVLLDYYTRFMVWVGHEQFLSDGNAYNTIEEALLKYKSLHEVRDSISKFNSSEEFSKIPPLPGAVNVLNDLYNQGFKIDVISSCGDSDLTFELRKKNLLNEFGDIFNDITLIPLGSSKKPYLEKYRDTGFVWVEDSVGNYLIGEELGLKSVLVEGYFQDKFDPDEFLVFNDWKDLGVFIEDHHRTMITTR